MTDELVADELVHDGTEPTGSMNASRLELPLADRIVAAVDDVSVAIVEVITSLDLQLAGRARRPQLFPARVWTGRR